MYNCDMGIDCSECPGCETGLKKDATELKDYQKHDYYETGDTDTPKEICDNNGEVVLNYCRVCGGVEACMPTNCPGRKLTVEETMLIAKGILDF